MHIKLPFLKKNKREKLPVKAAPKHIQELQAELESGFLGFWIKQYRMSYLIVIALIVLGVVSMIQIQKESSPNIKFGIIAISTVYPGASPVDVDSLITDKIYKEIKDLEGAKKITSTSSLGVSSVSIELQPEADVTNFMNDVRNSISRMSFPKDAKTPNVIEIKSQSNFVKGVTLYSPDKSVSLDKLRLLGGEIKDALSLLPSIQKVEYGSVLNYDVQVVFDKETLKWLGITITEVANAVRSFNQDIPIGNFGVGDKNYDFRVKLLPLRENMMILRKIELVFNEKMRMSR
jgi:multidrug efflux pump subunit AcrB